MSGAETLIAGLLAVRTGQQLSPARRWRIDTVLKPLVREHGLADLDELVARIVAGDSDTAEATIEALLNNESSFFRDAAIFEMLDREVLPRLAAARARERRLRIWCAGCAVGQEPYSLAMMIRDGGARWTGWTIDILATDISNRVIARARAGRYSQFEIQRGLAVRAMLRWFVQDEEDWIADPSLRKSVRFMRHNILDPAPRSFDLVLCRNVLMYFAPDARKRAFDRIADALAPDGALVLGAGETVIGQTNRFVVDARARGIYVHSAAAAPIGLARTG